MLKRIALAVQFLLAASVSMAQVQLKITLSGTPTSFTIEKKNLKYGKAGVFCLIYDDRVLSALDGYSIMPSFTDGAGNPVRATATIASNGVNAYEQDAGVMSLAQLKTFVDNAWGISCHGYIHTIPPSWADKGYTVRDNVINNRRYHYNKLKALGSEYVLRTGVGPNADKGYQTAWKQIGSLCGSSQNTYDGLEAIPSADWINNGVGDIAVLTSQYKVFARSMGDIKTQEAANILISKLNTLVQQSSAPTNKILVFGTHATDNTFLSPVFNYLQANANDKIWMTSLHELMEYAETSNKTSIEYTQSGNVLTVTLKQSFADAARWRDLSLGVISDKTIVNIESTGADRVTFNAATGLINVFKKKTSGFTDPDPVGAPLPVHFISFSEKDGELRWTVGDKDNFSHYEIEKSTDGINFFVIAKTSAESFKDAGISNQQFYRIKAIDKDGSYVYSNIIRVIDSQRKSTTVTPIEGGIRVNFYSGKNQQGELAVFNTTGQMIFKSKNHFAAGWNFMNIPMAERPAVYIVKVLNETVKIYKP